MNKEEHLSQLAKIRKDHADEVIEEVAEKTAITNRTHTIGLAIQPIETAIQTVVAGESLLAIAVNKVIAELNADLAELRKRLGKLESKNDK